MSVPFEDPRKTDLRERAEAAIEAAGHNVLARPQPIDYPPSSPFRGRILGDVQSVDGDENTHVFFVRPDAERPLPQWIHNTAMASHALDGVLVHVVVDASNLALEQGVQACGAGLLVVTLDMTLETRAEPGRPGEEEARAAIEARISELRIACRTKTDLNLKVNSDRFAKTEEITRGMPQARREEYLKGMEETDAIWRKWSEAISTDLDAVVSNLDEPALDRIESAIAAGAIPDDDPPGDQA